MSVSEAFIRGIPKAELHLHIEGSLEPELMFALGRRNRVDIPFRSVDEVRAAYAFSNLQDFLDIYYQGANVLQTEDDFRELALAYFTRLHADAGLHAEIFFDPETHTDRGLPFAVAIEGLLAGMREAEAHFGITSKLITYSRPDGVQLSATLYLPAGYTAEKDGRLPFLRPDAKSQVTMRYVDGKPHSIDTVVLSSQHSPEMSDGTKMKPAFIEAVIEEIIKPVLPKAWLKDTRYLVNPTGRFVIGGPQGVCGLTGRKIIVDTYGGACPHGGGAFSGKDPSKVDRSAAYAARYVAKNVVAAGLAKQCQVQVAYAIGVAKPMNVTVYTEGTGVISDEKIAAIVNEVFDLRPKGIIQMLDLLRPIYQKTAAYGHFGRAEPEFTWERTDKAAALRAAAGL